MIGLFNLKAFWHKDAINPFVNTVVVVEADKNLSDIIAEEVTKKKRTAEIVIARDLKSVESFDGKDVHQLLDLPF